MILHLLIALSIGSSPNDHLVPVSDFFQIYDLALKRHLLRHPRREVEMVCKPSFQPEFAVYIVNAGRNADKPGQPIVVLSEPMTQIWGALGHAAEAIGPVGDDFQKQQDLGFTALRNLRVDVATRKAPIDEDTLKQLEELWDAALADVRYPIDPENTLDGRSCDFADSVPEFGRRLGTARNPKAPSAMYSLTMIGYELAEYVRQPIEKREESRQRIRAMIAVARGWFLSSFETRR